MTMKRNVLATSYEIPISMEMYNAVVDRDRDMDTREKCLYTLLEEIDGVFNIDYDGCFGLFIFLSIETKYDNEKTWKAISGMVENYICKGEQHGKRQEDNRTGQQTSERGRAKRTR